MMFQNSKKKLLGIIAIATCIFVALFCFVSFNANDNNQSDSFLVAQSNQSGLAQDKIVDQKAEVPNVVFPNTPEEVLNHSYHVTDTVSSWDYIKHGMQVEAQAEKQTRNQLAFSPHSFAVHNKAYFANTKSNDPNYVYWSFSDGTLSLSSNSSMGYPFDTSQDIIPPWFDEGGPQQQIITVNILDDISPSNTKMFFNGPVNDKGEAEISNITKILGLNKLDMTNVVDASYMFAGCKNFTDEQTKKAVMKGDFNNLENAFCMFGHSSFDNSAYQTYLSKVTSKVTNTSFFMSDCPGLTSIDASNLDLSGVSNASCMFCRDTNVTSVTNFILDNDKIDLTDFFYNCAFETFDVSGIAVYNDVNFSYFFEKCDKLKKIYSPVDATWTKSIGPNKDVGMFDQCWYLVGSQGTNYKYYYDHVYGGTAPTYSPKDFAKIDGGTENPGFFEQIVFDPWLSMQGECSDGSKINFYPAFNMPSDVDGYKFAVKKGNTYTEIPSDNITMSDIYKALMNTSISGSKTLYYQKTDSSKPAIKCYTTVDISWENTFKQKAESTISNEYADYFVNQYQRDKSGNDNAIVTAEIGEGYNLPNVYGSGWDITDSSSKNVPYINGVSYNDFLNNYGGPDKLLSHYAHEAWGSSICPTDNQLAMYYEKSDTNTGWASNPIDNDEKCVVLAHEFEGESYEPDYLTLKMEESGPVGQTVSFSVIAKYWNPESTYCPTLQHREKLSFDEWTPWTTFTGNPETWKVEGLEHAGDKIQLRGSNPKGFVDTDQLERFSFNINNKYSISGNIMTLLNYKHSVNVIPNKGCFFSLFQGEENGPNCLTKVEENTLPAMELKEFCYDSMFKNQTNLTIASKLPATNMKLMCYNKMFSNCTNLEEAPYLPAKLSSEQPLADEAGCYNSMFDGCSKLNKISVGFTKFPKTVIGESVQYTSTYLWMNGVTAAGTIKCVVDGKEVDPEFDMDDYVNPNAIPWPLLYNVKFALSGNGHIYDNAQGFGQPVETIKIARNSSIKTQKYSEDEKIGCITFGEGESSKTYYAVPDKLYQFKEFSNVPTKVMADVEIGTTFEESPVSWCPMQVDSKIETINFYPAIKQKSDIDGYIFAKKIGDTYIKLENTDEQPLSMAKIYNALKDEENKTLYYYKFDTSKPPLKAYTTRNIDWDFVFDQPNPGEAKKYTESFSTNYQKNKEGVNNGIVTAEIGEGGDKPNVFGEQWNISTQHSDISPKINNVFYSSSTSSDSFYKSYGGKESKVMVGNDSVWGSYKYANEGYPFYFNCEKCEWDFGRGNIAIVLAREFGDLAYEWHPMQAKSAGEADPINFYPAFSKPSDVNGYKFAVKVGDEYKEIPSTDISMESIGTALNKTGTAILYFHKTDMTKEPIKCYTNRNMNWDSVFYINSSEGTAQKYNENFAKNYTDKGIYTAELGIVKDDGSIVNPFGEKWDLHETGDKTIPLVNGVPFFNSGNIKGFYDSYISVLSSYVMPWGTYVYTTGSAFYFDKDYGWDYESYDIGNKSVVLVCEF